MVQTLPMIASLNGTIQIKDPPFLILDVHGVGYKVLVPTHILSTAHVGQQMQLFTYTHVREEVLELYGFMELLDLKLFEHLIGVSGIGPKTVIGILALHKRDAIIQAIVTSDVSFFTKVPRLGKKNAQKIIIELKGKIGTAEDLVVPDIHLGDTDAIDALKSFGFTLREITDALKAIEQEGQSTEQKITLALKYLGK